jgi:hypothetical protein
MWSRDGTRVLGATRKMDIKNAQTKVFRTFLITFFILDLLSRKLLQCDVLESITRPITRPLIINICKTKKARLKFAPTGSEGKERKGREWR